MRTELKLLLGLVLMLLPTAVLVFSVWPTLHWPTMVGGTLIWFTGYLTVLLGIKDVENDHARSR